MRPTYLTRDEVARRRRRERAPDRRGDRPRGGQARGGAAEDRRGSRQRLLQGDVLLDQPFAKDNKKTVQKVLDEAGVTAKRFARFQVGV